MGTLHSTSVPAHVVLAQAQPCIMPCMLVTMLQDVPHTFANHPWLHEPDGQAALRRVLSAFSVHNPAMGYCRSINQIVALLLVALNRCDTCSLCWPVSLAGVMLLQCHTADQNMAWAVQGGTALATAHHVLSRVPTHLCLLLLPSDCRNQEAAFWLLAALVEDILPLDNYNSNLVGCQVSAGEALQEAMLLPSCCNCCTFLLHPLPQRRLAALPAHAHTH